MKHELMTEKQALQSASDSLRIAKELIDLNNKLIAEVERLTAILQATGLRLSVKPLEQAV